MMKPYYFSVSFGHSYNYKNGDKSAEDVLTRELNLPVTFICAEAGFGDIYGVKFYNDEDLIFFKLTCNFEQVDRKFAEEYITTYNNRYRNNGYIHRFSI